MTERRLQRRQLYGTSLQNKTEKIKLTRYNLISQLTKLVATLSRSYNVAFSNKSVQCNKSKRTERQLVKHDRADVKLRQYGQSDTERHDNEQLVGAGNIIVRKWQLLP